MSHVHFFVPSRSSWTKRLITAKDHAAVQINIGNVDAATGRYTGEFKTFALCGYVRDKVSDSPVSGDCVARGGWVDKDVAR